MHAVPARTESAGHFVAACAWLRWRHQRCGDGCARFLWLLLLWSARRSHRLVRHGIRWLYFDAVSRTGRFFVGLQGLVRDHRLRSRDACAPVGGEGDLERQLEPALRPERFRPAGRGRASALTPSLFDLAADLPEGRLGSGGARPRRTAPDGRRRITRTPGPGTTMPTPVPVPVPCCLERGLGGPVIVPSQVMPRDSSGPGAGSLPRSNCREGGATDDGDRLPLSITVSVHDPGQGTLGERGTAGAEQP